jgi:hypothetical protein
MAYPRFRRARNHKLLYYTAGDFTISSTTFITLSASMDLTLQAQVGDTIEYGIHGIWNNNAVNSRLDVATVVGGSPVNYFSGAPQGMPAWVGLSGTYSSITGVAMRVLTATDVSGGVVTLRLLAKVDAATAKVINGSASTPLMVYAKNLGPVDST